MSEAATVAVIAGGFALLNVIVPIVLRWTESRQRREEDVNMKRIAKLEAQIENLQHQLTEFRDKNITLTVELAFKNQRVQQLEEELREARKPRLVTEGTA